MKNIFAILTGILIGTLFFILFGALSASFQSPLPAGLAMSDPAYNPARVEATPRSSWVVTLTGIVLGAFLAGAAGTAISSAKKPWITSWIGALLSLWVFYGLFMVPEIPFWFDLASLAAYLLFTYLGGMVIREGS